jgi:hypothetical protein
VRGGELRFGGCGAKHIALSAESKGLYWLLACQLGVSECGDEQEGRMTFMRSAMLVTANL